MGSDRRDGASDSGRQGIKKELILDWDMSVKSRRWWDELISEGFGSLSDLKPLKSRRLKSILAPTPLPINYPTRIPFPNRASPLVRSFRSEGSRMLLIARKDKEEERERPMLDQVRVSQVPRGDERFIGGKMQVGGRTQIIFLLRN